MSGLSARSEEYRVWLAWRLLAEIGGARRARADGIALAGLFADTAVGRSIDVGGGAFAARTRVGVEWRRSPAEPLVESPLAVPGVLTLSGGNRLVTRWGDPADDGLRGPTVGLLDAERVVGSLFVRPRRAGDRVRRPGGLGSKTLADCWSEAGVAADRREALPVVCDEGGVVWAPWAGPDERVSGLAQGGGRLVLDYQEIRYTDR